MRLTCPRGIHGDGEAQAGGSGAVGSVDGAGKVGGWGCSGLLLLAGCKDKGHPQQEQQATENPAATGQGSVQQGLIKIENPEVRV